MTASVPSAAAALLGVVLLAGALVGLRRRARERRAGALVRVETDGPALLRSERYRLVGRPDELRAQPDGALVPVELKRRPLPRGGAFYSHTVQLWGYCLLVEEATGRSPPFALLRYRDGEVIVPWNAAARQALLALRRDALRPYDGRADPSPGKCARCVWAPRCDASAARGALAPVPRAGTSRPR